MIEVGARVILPKFIYNVLKDFVLSRTLVSSVLERASTAAPLKPRPVTQFPRSGWGFSLCHIIESVPARWIHGRPKIKIKVCCFEVRQLIQFRNCKSLWFHKFELIYRSLFILKQNGSYWNSECKPWFWNAKNFFKTSLTNQEPL